MEIKISDFKKVVFTKPKKGGDQGGAGGGGGSQSNQVPADVEMYNPFGEESGEEGKEKEGEKGGEGKAKKGEGEGKKGQGEGEEGAEGEKGGDGEGQGKGKSTGDTDAMTKEQIQKGAQELLDKLNKATNLPTNPCGSSEKRKDKQKNADPIEQAKIEQQAEIKRKQIEEILADAAEKGHKHVFNSGGSRGSGGKESLGVLKGDAVPIRMRKPEFLKKMKSFATKEYEKEYFKKGTDWFYTQAYGNVVFKDRPKISVPQKFVYIMVDVSGSMFGDFEGTGKSLLEHLLGYLPVIAEDFKGQVWWISDGLLTFKDGTPGITLLSDYKDMSVEDQGKYFNKIQEARGAGGGTTFAVELQAVQDMREGKIHQVVKDALKGNLLKTMIGKPKPHQASIIMLTDSYIDQPRTTYMWKGEKVTGFLPPSTMIMTDEQGCEYMKDTFPEDFKDKELRIECYDITEDGKYKLNKKLN